MAGGKGFISQLFSSNGSWTAPAGVTQVILIGSGGGQGGNVGYGSAGNLWPHGGKGVVPSMKVITVVPNTTYSITIGAGGAGGRTPANPSSGTGALGGNSTFGALATFYGASAPPLVGNTFENRAVDPNVGCSYSSGNAIDQMGWNAAGTKGASSGTYRGGSSGGCGLTGNGGAGGNGNNSGNGFDGGTSSSTNYGAGGGAGGSGSSGSGGKGGNGIGGFITVLWVEG